MDPLKQIFLQIGVVLVSAISIVNFFKPLAEIAAQNAVCSNCDSASSIVFMVIAFFGAIGIVIYKLMKIFYNGGTS